jgi:flagellar basal body-associated protein FliL
MRRLIFMLILLPFLVGGGIGAYLYLWKEEPVADAPPPLPPVPVLLFTSLSPVTISLIGPDRAEQLVTLRLVLEVPNTAALERIQAMQPRLHNALTETLYTALSDPSVQSNSIIDLPRLRRRLLAACDRTIGRGIVAQVLIHGITQRPV